MPRYVPPEKKASCTVSFRLTVEERRLLEHLSEVLGLSQTDLLRQLLRGRANALGIEEVPARPRPRRGRPRVVTKVMPSSEAGAETPSLVLSGPPVPGEDTPLTASAVVEIPIIVEHDTSLSIEKPATLEVLIAAFREHFSSRAEGTRRDMEEALRFFTVSLDESIPLLDPRLPLVRLEPQLFDRLRDRVRGLDETLARKNLYLTYLRMMLQFGVRDPRFALSSELTQSILPLTAIEAATGLFKGRPPGQ